MHVWRNIREALRSLLSAKQRSLLALLGIVIGVGAVIAMITIGSITQQEAMRQFKEMGTDILLLNKGYDSTCAEGMTAMDAAGLPRACSDIAAVAPYVSSFGVLRFDGRNMDGALLGVTQSFLDVNKLSVVAGRFISDLDGVMHFCVVGGNLAAMLREGGEQELIGQRIQYGEHVLTVVGELAPASMTAMRPYEINDGVLVPLSLGLRLATEPYLTSIIVRRRETASLQSSKQQIESYFEHHTKVGSVEIMSAEELIRQMQKQMQMFTMLLGAIGGISLIVGGVGVMNVMLVSVVERRREIGIRRALGARQIDIQLQFLVESIILCLAGGVIGVGVGLGAARIVAHLSGWQYMISYEAVILGVVVAGVVGIFFGFYPARQASRMKTIEALRYD